MFLRALLQFQQLRTNGGAEGDRTPDLYAASVALSQLSYGPILHKTLLHFMKLLLVLQVKNQ